MNFVETLKAAWRERNSLVCVGLDPDPGRLPVCIRGPDEVFDFCREVIDATAPYACAFKPQIAYFAALGAEDALARIIDHIHNTHPGIPVILDAKRGDIGATASMYAIEAFERYGADAVTVNPYMGGDTLQPFLRHADRGVIILCRTSNPGSGDVQALESAGESVSRHIARKAANEWNDNGNVALVVGATWPEELAAVRSLVGEMPLLIPGIGAQGGDIAAVMAAGADARGHGLIINASRSILYAGNGGDFAEAAAAEASRLRDEINQHRNPSLA